MKKNLLFFILFGLCFTPHAQPAVKVFAFEQQSSPGTIPARLKGENGNPERKAAAKNNYFLFLSFGKNYLVTPIRVFIRGTYFSVRTTEIRKAPVEYINNMIPRAPEKIILVPKTDREVLEIELNESSPGDHIQSRKQLSKNDVVIEYMWNKKMYYATQKKMKRMEPAFNE